MPIPILGAAWFVAKTGLAGIGAYFADREWNDGRAKNWLGKQFRSATNYAVEEIGDDVPALKQLKSVIPDVDIGDRSKIAREFEEKRAQEETEAPSTDKGRLGWVDLFSMLGGTAVGKTFLGDGLKGWFKSALFGLVVMLTVDFFPELKGAAEKMTGYDLDFV